MHEENVELKIYGTGMVLQNVHLLHMVAECMFVD